MKRLTRFLPVDPRQPDPGTLEEASEIVRQGGLVAFPTETVYGLGADATDPAAVLRIFEAKGRPATNPLIVHGPDIADVRLAASRWPDTADRLARRFWPGPLTLVLPRSEFIPDAVTAGQATVGIRVPDCVVAREFLRCVGRLVAAPSANRSTGVSPTTADHVLRELDGRIDLVLDGGPTPVGIESTVLDLTSDLPRVLRPGAITAAQIGQVLGVEIASPEPGQAAIGSPRKSPGQMDVHYSPRTPLWVIEAGEATTHTVSVPGFGLIVAGHHVADLPGVFDRRVDWTDPARAARDLYATLHHWDDGSLTVILVVLPPDVDAWRAVRDRLWRASRRWSREGP